jgi:hypothetical protein
VLSAVVAALSFAAAPQPPSGAPQQRTCKFEDEWGSNQDREVPPGIALLSGLFTGMSEAQVKSFSPRLLYPDPASSFELAPGVRGRATAVFSSKTHRLNSVELSGSNPTETYDALVRDFGPPKARRPMGTFNFSPAQFTGGVSPSRDELVKWCPGDLDLVLWIRADDFLLYVNPALQ